MNRLDLAALSTFTVVAAERSFTRAAAKLGMSQSALSHSMRALEARLGVALLSRTTRSVATTEAGEELLRSLLPAFDDIDAGLERLGQKRSKPSGTVRLTMVKHAAMAVVLPALPAFLAQYPDIKVEVDVHDAFTDIVAERFDAGIRFGEKVAKDMVAVRVGPDVRAAVVASPKYLAKRPPPRSPRELTAHPCINYRLASARSIYAWEFRDRGRRLEVRVDGPLVVNDGDLLATAALDGHGIAYLFEHSVAEHLKSGRLVRLLEKWCPPMPGFYLYYPSRRQTSPALAALVSALRYEPRR